jgi:serine/threonine-protein kinase
VVLVVLLAGALGGGGAYAWFESQTPSYDIPVLVGLSEEAARLAVDDYGFTIDKRTERKDGSTPGQVISTDPEAGQSLEKGGTLVLVVSQGNTLAAVPVDLVGKPLPDAVAALEAAGGFVAVPTEAFDEAVAAGVVVAVGPDLAAELPKGSEVPLVVSKGPEPRTIPGGLAGKTYAQAAAALADVQLGAKQVDEFNDTVPVGQVLGTRPAGGQQAPRDTVIEVVVSKGPDLVKVPAVAGKDLAGAIAALEAAGLNAGDVHGPAAGRPFETDPPVGTSVKRGATVDIFLRR